MQAKRDVAFEFYRERGMNPGSIDSHLDGIDFRHPVDVITIRKNTVLEQFQVQGGRQGSYYSEGGVTPSQLGINPQGQVLGPDRQPLLGADGQPIIADKVVTRWLVLDDVQVLRSQAGAITDTWSVPGQAFDTQGGGIQFYSPERNKFQQLPPIVPGTGTGG